MPKKRHRGHFCWCCQRVLANEQFSGRGHAQHLCKQCTQLPQQERDYRQAVLDIDRVLARAGKFRRKLRHLERFQDHPDERVRTYLAESTRPPWWGDEPEAIDPPPLDDLGEDGEIEDGDIPF